MLSYKSTQKSFNIE